MPPALLGAAGGGPDKESWKVSGRLPTPTTQAQQGFSTIPPVPLVSTPAARFRGQYGTGAARGWVADLDAGDWRGSSIEPSSQAQRLFR